MQGCNVPRLGVLVVLAFGFLTAAARADEAFYAIPLPQLQLAEGKLPPTTQPDWERWRTLHMMRPYAAIDGTGESVVARGDGAAGVWQANWNQPEQLVLVVHLPESRDVKGRLFLPKVDGSGMEAVRFEIPAAHATPDAREQFCRAQKDYYEGLLREGHAGAAWFRHRAAEARRELGDAPPPDDRRPQPPSAGSELADTYALMSGGRAVSENLQLDRELPTTRESARATVETSNIKGITVAAMDFKPLLAAASPQLDPLATYIPADQHAVFFPSFAAMTSVIDASADGMPALRLAEPRSEDAGTRARYERQMGLPLDDLARLMGPLGIRSVAATGSDPYLRTGTDLAILFEAENAPALRTALAARIEVSRLAMSEKIETVSQTIEGIEVSVTRSPSRAVSSYLATIGGNVVVVANSAKQIERIILAQRDGPALASLDEYRFYRTRYPRSDESETAFLMLSDATIRRWCGPAWRIGASRRTRAAAIMSELQAKYMNQLARGKIEAGPVHTERPHPDLGELRLGSDGVSSSVYGSLQFLTPISALDVAKVTDDERISYERWRNNYQSNWRWAFDPIGARLTSNNDRLEADVTVMPLIWGTDYRFAVDISRGAKIAPAAADLHGALAHLSVAINQQANSTRSYLNLARNFAPGIGPDPLAWMGPAISLFIDDDPRWGLTEPAEPRPQDMAELPVGLVFENKDNLRLAAFLTAIRVVIDQTAPDMVDWESLKHGERSYVKITARQTRNPDDPKFSMYYAPTSPALLVAFSEATLKSMLERAQAPATQPAANQPATPRPLLGDNLCLQLDRRMIDRVMPHLGMSRNDPIQTEMQRAAWSNLPILNEWKRLYPDQDVVALHERVWKTRLVSPDGKGYQWNEAYQTMESTTYGSPAQPRHPEKPLRVLEGFEFLNFGITFEENGLRGHVALEKTKPN